MAAQITHACSGALSGRWPSAVGFDSARDRQHGIRCGNANATRPDAVGQYLICSSQGGGRREAGAERTDGLIISGDVARLVYGSRAITVADEIGVRQVGQQCRYGTGLRPGVGHDRMVAHNGCSMHQHADHSQYTQPLPKVHGPNL